MATESEKPKLPETMSAERSAAIKLVEGLMAAAENETRDDATLLGVFHGAIEGASETEKEQIREMAEGVLGEKLEGLKGDTEREWLEEVTKPGAEPEKVIADAGGVYAEGFQKLVDEFGLDASKPEEVVKVAKMVRELVGEKSIPEVTPPAEVVPVVETEVKVSEEKALVGVATEPGDEDVLEGEVVEEVIEAKPVEPKVEEVVVETPKVEEPKVEEEKPVTEEVKAREEERDWQGEYETLKAFGPDVVGKWVADNIRDLPAEMRDMVKADIGVVKEKVKEREITREDRARLLHEVMEAVGYNGGTLRHLSRVDVDEMLTKLNTPESLRKEAHALVAMMNLSVVKHHFMDKIVTFFPLVDREKQETVMDIDVERVRIFLNGYSDELIALILTAHEGLGQRLINEALKVQTAIIENPARVSELLGRELTEDEDRDLNKLTEAYKGGNGSIQVENEMVAFVAKLLKSDEYYSRLAFMLFEALIEPEKNSKHPCYSLTHTNEHADIMSGAGIWWGSMHWWDREFADLRPRGTRNAMPDRLLMSGLSISDRLRIAVLEDDKGDAIRVIMEMAGKNKIKELSGKAITYGVQAHIALTDISPSTEGEKLTADALWKVRKTLLSVNITNEARQRALTVAALIFFKELSVEGVAAGKNEGRTLRMRTPNGLFSRFVYIALRRPVRQDDGSIKMTGLFDLPKGKVRKVDGEESYPEVSDVSGKILNRVRANVLRYMKAVPKRLIPSDERRDLTGALIYDRFLPKGYLDTGGAELIDRMVKAEF